MRHFRGKLILLISLLVAVSQLVTGFFISRQSEEALDAQQREVVKGMARNISRLSTRAFLSRDLATLYEHVQLAMQEKNILYVKIIDLNNKILMSETLAEVGAVVNATDPIFLGGRVGSKELDPVLMARIVEPVTLGSELLGHVLLGYSHAETGLAIVALREKILTTLLIGLVGAIIIAVLIAAMITRPLLKLERCAAQIASGDFDLVRPKVKGDDGFSLLSQTMYTMARRLESLVYKDPLTGVYNRLFLNNRLQEELARSCRHDWSLAMLMIDIDHFKRINDTHGHLVGDEMLCSCARILSDHIREEDCLSRFGGEEFVILAPNMVHESAIQLAERIRGALAGETFTSQLAAKPITMTISIGVAIYPEQANSENGLILKADQALYQAKLQGRNRVILSS